MQSVFWAESDMDCIFTKQMTDSFREGAKTAGHQVDIVDVCHRDIAGCLACEYCHTTGWLNNGLAWNNMKLKSQKSSFPFVELL